MVLFPVRKLNLQIVKVKRNIFSSHKLKRFLQNFSTYNYLFYNTS